MKLEKILDKLGSIEKNSFIKIIDNIISKNPKNTKEIDKILSSSDKGLKSVDNQNISTIFALTSGEFQEHIKCEFQEITSQLDILIDIIIRDGNCIMKQDWFSRLYETEIKNLKNRIKNLNTIFNNKKDRENFSTKLEDLYKETNNSQTLLEKALLKFMDETYNLGISLYRTNHDDIQVGSSNWKRLTLNNNGIVLKDCN